MISDMKTIGIFLLTILLSFFAFSGDAWAKSFLIDKDIPVSSNVSGLVTPHKAIYEISLKSAKSSSQIVDISGKMFYSWEAACDGWTTDHRFKLLYEYADTAPVEVKSDFTTFEDFAGQELDFNSRRKRNEKLFEEFRGKANFDKSSGSGHVTYSVPDDIEHVLPENVLFPVTHTLKLIEQAQKKKRLFNAVIFDGSDEEGAYEVNAFIGKAKAHAKTLDIKGIDPKLLKTKLWPVRLAFFPVSQKSSEPEYEMQLDLHESGIVSDMVISYEDFSVSQKLIALEAFNWPECK